MEGAERIKINLGYEPIIHSTFDYDRFHLLDDNRSILEDRKNRIFGSVMQVGWQPSPIQVNKDMEIVDGQGRWAVAKEHGLPLLYYVTDDVGITECRAMNASMTPWSDEQYIESYTKDGYESYIRVSELMGDFRWAKLTNVIMACTGRMSASGAIKSGTLDVSEEHKVEAVRLLTYAAEVNEVVMNYGDEVSGGFVNSVMFAYQCDGCDPEHLAETCGKYADIIDRFKKIIDMLQEMSRFYNENIRRRRIPEMDFNVEYRKSFGKPGSWYSEKWGHYPSYRHRDDEEEAAQERLF